MPSIFSLDAATIAAVLAIGASAFFVGYRLGSTAALAHGAADGCSSTSDASTPLLALQSTTPLDNTATSTRSTTPRPSTSSRPSNQSTLNPASYLQSSRTASIRSLDSFGSSWSTSSGEIAPAPEFDYDPDDQPYRPFPPSADDMQSLERRLAQGSPIKLAGRLLHVDHILSLLSGRPITEELVDAYLRGVLVSDNDKRWRSFNQHGGRPPVNSIWAYPVEFFPACSRYVDVKHHTDVTNLDIFEEDVLLVPLTRDGRWSSLSVEPLSKTIRLFVTDANDPSAHATFDTIALYLDSEHQARKGHPLDHSEWRREVALNYCLDPDVVADSGIVACQAMETACRQSTIGNSGFSPSDVRLYRKVMAYELAFGVHWHRHLLM